MVVIYNKNKNMGKQKTTEQFIAEAIVKHGDKYDYSNVVYTNKNNKIILCILNNIF